MKIRCETFAKKVSRRTCGTAAPLDHLPVICSLHHFSQLSCCFTIAAGVQWSWTLSEINLHWWNSLVHHLKKMLNKAAYLLLVNLASASTFIRFCRSVRKVYLCTTHLCNAMHPANFALLSFSHFPIHSLKSGIGNLQECSNRVVLSIQHPSRPELQLHKGFLREAVVLQNSKEMCWVASDEITHHMIGSRVPSGNFPWNFLSDVVELLCVKKGMQHPPLKDSVSFNNSSRCGAFRAVHDCHAHETQDFCYRKDSFKNSNHLFLNIIVASETAHFIYVEQKVSISSRWWCYIDLWWYIYISHWEYIYMYIYGHIWATFWHGSSWPTPGPVDGFFLGNRPKPLGLKANQPNFSIHQEQNTRRGGRGKGNPRNTWMM